MQLGLEFFYLAFLDLTTCRTSIYNSEGPISWIAIDKWAERYNVTDDQYADLMYHIGMMDATYLEHKTKKMQAGQKAIAPKKRSK